MARTNFEELLEAGVHFGHLKRKWHPAMAPYIFMEKNGIHIIDLHKTVAKIDESASLEENRTFRSQDPFRCNEKTSKRHCCGKSTGTRNALYHRTLEWRNVDKLPDHP